MPMLIKKVLRRKHLLLIALVFTIIATCAFLMPGSSIPSIKIDTFIGIDKIVHAGIHFVLVLCWLVYYATHTVKVKVSNVVFIVVSCVIYGIVIELLQGMTDTRSSELADIYANMTGTALGTLVFLVLKPKIEIKP